MASPVPSGGTKDVRVDRIEEGGAGLATYDNVDPNSATKSEPLTATRASFDSATATGVTRATNKAVFDTSGTSGLDQAAALKRSKPEVY